MPIAERSASIARSASQASLIASTSKVFALGTGRAVPGAKELWSYPRVACRDRGKNYEVRPDDVCSGERCVRPDDRPEQLSQQHTLDDCRENLRDGAIYLRLARVPFNMNETHSVLTDLAKDQYPNDQHIEDAGHEEEKEGGDVTGAVSEPVQHVPEFGFEMVFARDSSVEEITAHDDDDERNADPEAQRRMRLIRRQHAE